MKTNEQKLIPKWGLWPSRLLFAAAIIFISQQMLTSNPMAISVFVWDKFLHFSAWGLAVTLVYYSCRSQQRFTIAVVVIFAYSTFIEILQLMAPQRTFSFGDILANGLGCLAAMLLVPRVDRWLYQQLRHPKDQLNIDE